MLKGTLVRIEELFSQLKPSERKVAAYILEHPEEIISYSVQKLAALANVSEATIVRFSRTMQCKGFQELKLRIAYDLNEYTDKTKSLIFYLISCVKYVQCDNFLKIIKDTPKA